jgi:group I intron endonuclease
MKKAGIYQITSPINKIYIGLSLDIEARWKKYKFPSTTRAQTLLHHSFKKYGYDAHQFEILELCEPDIEFLAKREIFWIKNKNSYHPNNKDNGLNLTRGGNLPNKQIGPMPEDQKKKISESHKGKKHSEETKEKIRKIKSGIKQNPNIVAKRAASLRGKPSKLKGRKRPNISEKLLGKASLRAIKCEIFNELTQSTISAKSIIELSQKSGIPIGSIYNLKKNKPSKKYKHLKYKEYAY